MSSTYIRSSSTLTSSCALNQIDPKDKIKIEKKSEFTTSENQANLSLFTNQKKRNLIHSPICSKEHRSSKASSQSISADQVLQTRPEPPARNQSTTKKTIQAENPRCRDKLINTLVLERSSGSSPAKYLGQLQLTSFLQV
ncbi:hypothetical protein Dimus_032249 [Dionaea muscipula]